MALQGAVYRPRDAEHTVLHQVIAEHLEVFLRAVVEAATTIQRTLRRLALRSMRRRRSVRTRSRSRGRSSRVAPARARSSGPAVISEARAQSASCPATAAFSLCQTASACTRSSAGCTSHRSSSCRCARWSALHRRACRRAWPGSVPQTVRRRALLDSRPSWGEKKIERRRLWPKRDTTAWTTVRRTRHIIGTCVRGNLWTVEKMSDRAPLGVSTICATPLIAAYLRLSRLSGNFSNRRAVRQRAGDTGDREL